MKEVEGWFQSSGLGHGVISDACQGGRHTEDPHTHVCKAQWRSLRVSLSDPSRV